jgi:hypothetical protein
MTKRDINGLPYIYENKDELAFGTDYMESEEYAKEHDEHNLQSSIVNTLDHLGMNVMTEKDIPYLIEHGITLHMLMGAEPFPEKYIEHLKKEDEEKNK